MALHSTRKHTSGASGLTGGGRILHWLGIVAMVIGLFAPLLSLDAAAATPMSPERARMLAQQQPLDRDIAGFERVVLVGDFQAQFGCNPFDVNCDQTRLQANNGLWTGAFPVPPGSWNWELVGVDFANAEYSLANGQVNIAEGQAGVYAEFNSVSRDDNVQPVTLLANVNGPFGTVALAPDGAGYVASFINVENDGPVDMQVTIGDVTVPVNTNLAAGSNRVSFDASGNILNVESEGYGEVTIIRSDADGNPLPGSCFVVEGANQSRGCDSDDGQVDGAILLRFPSGFEPGTYTLRETTPADGQEALDDQQADIQAGRSTIELRSEGAATGDLVVLRQDNDGNPVGGTCFEVFDASGTSVGSACDEDGDVPDDGRIGIFAVPAGDVTLRETRTPDGVEPAGDTGATVSADQATDVPVRSAAIVLDVPTEAPTEIPTEEPTDVPTEEPTDVPTEEPTEIATEEPTAVPQPGRVVVYRTDANGAAVGGACFELIDGSGNSIAENCDEDGLTADDGVTGVVDVPPGTYTLRESRTPEGNQTPSDTQVIVQPGVDTEVVVAAAVVDQPTEEPTAAPTDEATEVATQTPTEVVLPPTAGAALVVTFPYEEGQAQTCIELDTGGAIGMLDLPFGCDNADNDTDPAAGVIRLEDLPAGQYLLDVYQGPDSLVQSDPRPITIVDGETASVTYEAPVPVETSFVIRTSDGTNPVGGACYQIDGGGEQCDDGSGALTISNVLPGDYLVSITSAPEGYTAPDPVQQLVTVSADGSTDVTFTLTVATVSVVVNTLDAETNQLVPGACYTLSGEAQECDETASGQVVFEDIEPTERSLTMTSAPDGFEPAAEQLVPAGVTTLDVQVEAITGTINVTVLDENGDALPNACIAVAGIGDLLCDNDGVISVPGVAEGTYAVSLSGDLGVYEAPATQEAVITAEGNTVDLTFNLSRATTSFTIVTTDGTNAVGGACYQIDGGGEQCDDGSGSLTINGVLPGEYQVSMTTAPAGYTLPDPAQQPVSVAADGSTQVQFTVAPATTSLSIVTTDGTNPVGDACYQIDGGGDPVCDEGSGTLTVPNILPGNRMVTMTTAPDGYTIPDPQTVPVAADGSSSVTFTLARATIDLQVTTLDGETSATLPGACYALDGAEPVCDTAGEGVVVFTGVEPVEHSLVMTTAPVGYIPAGDQTVPAGTAALNVPLQVQTGSLVITIVDANNAPLPGACVSIDNGNPLCDDDNDGRFEISALPLGERSVAVTSVPSGYDLPAQPQTATIAVDPGATINFQIATTPPATGGLDVTVRYSDDSLAEGACVTVTLSGDDTQRDACDGGEGDTNPEPGIVGFDELPTGTYEVALTPGSETARPLQTTTPVSATVVAGERAAVTLTLPLAPETGVLQIVTTAGGSNLGGACFTVNSIVVCDNDGTDADGTAGVVLLNDLAPGEYQVSMTTVPGGYEQPGAQSATVAAGDTARLDFELTRLPQPGSITVNTRNSNGDPLLNACYALMQSGTRVASQCDGSPADGVVSLPNIPAGNYQLVQTQSPGGQYATAPTQSVEVSAGEDTVVDIVMDLRPGRLTVITADRDEPTLILLNACYTLAGATEFGPFCDADDGNVDGRVRFTNLPAGNYELRQTVASAGYDPAANRTVTIAAGGSLQVTVQNAKVPLPVERGTLVVVPLDPNGNPVAGGCYQVFNGTTPLTQRVCDNADDQVGRITFANLPVGEFTLREQLAPSPDWQIAADITVTIRNGETTTVEVPHLFKTGTVVIQAVSTVGLPLQNACFTLTNAGAIEPCTDATGQATIGNLPPGTRQLTQTKAPFGFKLNTTPRDVIVRPGQTTTVRIVFENEPPPNTGTMQVQKFVCPAGDGGERTSFLGGAQGNNQLKQTVGCVPAVASFTLVAENGSTASNTSFKTNIDGRAQVTAENGIYLLTETEPDLPGNSAARIRVGTGQMTTVIVINYIAPPQPAPVTINVEGYTCAPGFSGSSFVDFQNSCMANAQLTNQITVRAESVNRYKRVTGDTGVVGKTSFVDLPAGTYTIWAERPFSIPLTYLFCGPDPVNPTLKAVNGSVVTTQASGTTVTCRVFQVPPLFDATHGAIQVQKYNCPIEERQRGYDYKTECSRATESIRFQIQRVDPATKNKSSIGDPIQASTNGDGIVQFPMLAAGTYKLTEVDGVWCFAQSNSVDSAGDVLVNVNKLSEVWIYNCVGTSEPPNTGSGDAANLLNPGTTPDGMQVLPNLLWPTVLLAGWMIRQRRFQA